MNKAWQIWLVMALIFCAGGVSGGLVAYHVAQKDIRHMPPPPEEWGRRHFEFIARRLELTAAQRKQVQPIVQRNIEELVKLRRQDMRKGWGILEHMEQEITVQLTPEQKVRYQELLRRRREFFRQRRKERAEKAGHRPPPAHNPSGGKPPPPPDGGTGP